MKKILFIIDSLGIGGAEKSLVTLLSLLDYSRYEVDLQLFAHDGILKQFLPEKVHILPPLNYNRFLSQPIWRQLGHLSMLYARLKYSLRIRKRALSNADIAVIYWKTIGRHISYSKKKYDIALAYGQGVPTYYTIDKITAKKKLAWINIDYRPSGPTLDFQRIYYACCDRIVLVSEFVRNVFSDIFPEFAEKMYVCRDILDAEMIGRMSLLPTEKIINHTDPVLMTTGRLTQAQKGYDLALETAKILRDKGLRFRWYAIGDGPYRAEMERYITSNDLQGYFILLGSTANPYSYMRQCDVYVQTSRYEGYGLTLAEARILNRPVICTDFDGCRMQMIDGKNGLITSFEPKEIAEAIIRLLNDKELYSRIQEYLKKERKGNVDEIRVFLKLLDV